jgi:hypothetical protein
MTSRRIWTCMMMKGKRKGKGKGNVQWTPLKQPNYSILFSYFLT